MRGLVPIFVSFFISFGECNIALTFPEARFPPLDFLDTSRTMEPCGVPKPRNPYYTNLIVGTTYNFTWRMQYPHQGGYRLVLLGPSGEIIESLAPMNGLEFKGSEDATIQNEQIRFTKSCMECTVVLERQALEWGKSYRFRSCADVNILQAASADSVCNGRGTMQDGQCVCESGYTGDICQYLADCERDSDCLNEGKCVSEANSLVSKTCYCAYGYFGKNCDQNFNRQNDACFAYANKDETSFDKYGMFSENCYNKESFNEKDFIYFRKVKSDIEIILDFQSTSWLSLGWRPEGLDPSCRLFPDLEGVRSKRSQFDAPPIVFNNDEAPPTVLRNDDPPPLRVAQEGPRPKMPKNNGLMKTALEAPLHAMDCVDMVVGAVKDGRLKINDMYSRDRSTPLNDFWYEGELSFLAAYGAEIDGRTVIMFRRWMQEIEPTDHPLGPGRQFVIWAKGQAQGAYSHGAPSGLDGKHSNEDFYADDILKYHGNQNRGVHPLDFTIPPAKYPKPDDAAFGVHIAQGSNSLLRLKSLHFVYLRSSKAEAI
ncbi:unnamed protein product [Auanema sp. JU1783]|nr:unnamed protein product [Auanema sp. JU1783]